MIIRAVTLSAAMLLAASLPSFAQATGEVPGEAPGEAQVKVRPASPEDVAPDTMNKVAPGQGDGAREMTNEKFEEGSALNEAATAKDEVDGSASHGSHGSGQ